jgi:hypothetical protein
MTQHTCTICNKSFNTEEELQEHQRTAAHVVGKKDKESERPGGDQYRREDKIAS